MNLGKPLQSEKKLVDVTGIEPATPCLQSNCENTMWLHRLAFTYVLHHGFACCLAVIVPILFPFSEDKTIEPGLDRYVTTTHRLTAEVVKNQSAPFGVVCTEMGGILPSLVAPNSAPKMQSSQDLFPRPKRENGLHSLANITFDPIGNGAGPHSEKRTYQDLTRNGLIYAC